MVCIRIDELETFAKENKIPIMQKDGIEFLIDYIKKNNIKNILKVEIKPLEDLTGVLACKNDIFETLNVNNNLRVFYTDCFDIVDNYLIKQENLIVVCKKLSDEANELFKDYIVVFPKLEVWQIKDYVYSLAEGVAENKLDNLIDICKNDIYRLDQELSKLKLFTEQERKYVYDKFVDDGVFDDLSEHNIFNFSNAIIKKDIKSLTSLYKEIEKIELKEPIITENTKGFFKCYIKTYNQIKTRHKELFGE